MALAFPTQRRPGADRCVGVVANDRREPGALEFDCAGFCPGFLRPHEAFAALPGGAFSAMRLAGQDAERGHPLHATSAHDRPISSVPVVLNRKRGWSHSALGQHGGDGPAPRENVPRRLARWPRRVPKNQLERGHPLISQAPNQQRRSVIRTTSPRLLNRTGNAETPMPVVV